VCSILLQSFHIGTKSLNQFEDKCFWTIEGSEGKTFTQQMKGGGSKPQTGLYEKYIYECTCRESRCLCKHTSHPNELREFAWLVEHNPSLLERWTEIRYRNQPGCWRVQWWRRRWRRTSSSWGGYTSQHRFQRNGIELMEVFISKGDHFEETQEEGSNYDENAALQGSLRHSSKRLLEEFLRHESSQYWSALSSGRSLNSCTKSDLLVYFMESCTSRTISVEEELAVPDVLDLIIIYGGVLIHSVHGTNFKAGPLVFISTSSSAHEIAMNWNDRQE